MKIFLFFVFFSGLFFQSCNREKVLGFKQEDFIGTVVYLNNSELYIYDRVQDKNDILDVKEDSVKINLSQKDLRDIQKSFIENEIGSFHDMNHDIGEVMEFFESEKTFDTYSIYTNKRKIVIKYVYTMDSSSINHQKTERFKRFYSVLDRIFTRNISQNNSFENNKKHIMKDLDIN